MHGRVRLGVIGAGRNAVQRHLPEFASIPTVEFVAVANRTEESARSVAHSSPDAPRVFTQWTDLLRSDRVDAVLIGTWPDTHAEMTIAALEAGLHVLVEGRMAATLDQALRMRDSARLHPTQILQVVPSSLGLDIDDTVRAVIADDLGDLIAVEGSFCEGGFLDRSRPVHWRELREFSGIHIMSLGRRYEMLRRWIPAVTEVVAVGRIYVDQRPRERFGPDVSIDVPDVLSVVGTTSLGVMVTLNLYSGTGPPRNFMRLMGSRGALEIEAGRHLLLHRDDGASTALQAVGPGWTVERDFIASIVDGAPVGHCNTDEALEYMVFCDAVDRSLANGSERVTVSRQ